jgi:hypothetical protein
MLFLKIGGLNTHQYLRAFKVNMWCVQFTSNKNARFGAC